MTSMSPPPASAVMTENRPCAVPIMNITLWRSPVIGALLVRPRKVVWLPWGQAAAADWLGWGRKPSARRAAWYARWNGGRVLRLEDGFLRSWGVGSLYPPLSLVVDDVGIYYDSTRPSALENLLASNANLLDGIEAAVARAKALILEHRLSKYNQAPLLDDALLRPDDVGRVLVIDQTFGDLSVGMGGANADTFAAMLAAARAENPLATIYVKTHPEVTFGRKRGYLDQTPDDARTVVLRGAANPLSLIERMDRVYVVTSTMGFEALLAGKPVSVFGLPWYAGWGVTDDRLHCPRRIRRRAVDALFAAAYFHYARYLNPATHQRGTIFDVIEWLLRQRRMEEGCQGRKIAVGFSAVRRWAQASLFGPDAGRVAFAADAERLAALRPEVQDCLVHWGHSAPAWLKQAAQSTGARLLHMEDGFIRSVGLGSDLVPPQSFVLDERGLYFDPSGASDLEELLNTETFLSEELSRAKWVREFIVSHGITKYNVDPLQTPDWQTGGRPLLLVPGQVEDDASIKQGCADVRTNLGLLAAARAANPHAFIVYKPHPDVLAGNRVGRAVLARALEFADLIETRVSLVSCIEACSEVHTMTSLAGFDALLRGKRVVVHGRPFYAGWGLTEDRLSMPRRNRRLTLDALVAGALLRYPLYWDARLQGYTTCEAVLQRIVEQREALGVSGMATGRARRALRKLRNLIFSRIG
jgi:capsular polysaccharide export protein